MKTKQWIFVLEAIVSLTFIVSCTSDENLPSVSSVTEIEYAFGDSMQKLTATLSNVTGNVKSVDNQVSFLQVTPNGNDSNGYPLLDLTRTGSTPSDFEYGTIMVDLDNGSSAKVIIVNDPELVPSSDNDGEYDAFEKEWWKQDGIVYHTAKTYTSNNGNYEEEEAITLPWGNSPTSNIPSELIDREDTLNATRGWVMAYNLFNSSTLNGQKKVSKPYFALYNKYTGLLRVFYYQPEISGTGGLVSFIVRPTLPETEKYPFYHTLQYAIPVGISQAKNTALGCQVETDASGNTYEQYYTPYTIDPTLKEGWYAFDIDMSCYNPDATTLFNSKDRMSIDVRTSEKTSITLEGCFNGKSEGTTTTKSSSSTSSANGMNYNAAMESGTTGATDALACFMAGDYLKGIFKGGMSLWNFGNALLGRSTDDYETETVATGTINQSFNGKIDISGYATTATSNNSKSGSIPYNAYSKSDLVGRGVWSLQDSPIIYVVNDVLLGDDWGFVCDVKDGYYGYGGDPAVNNFNLFTFLDPKSLKFNINTSVFSNIRNAEMAWTYGVYPKQEASHTDPYRTLLRITPTTPKFINSTNKGKIYKSESSTFANMKYMDYPIDDMSFVSVDDSTKNKTVYEIAQKGAKYRYFGCKGNVSDTTSVNCFIIDPVVTLPSEVNKFYDFEAPDFVVGVTLKFEYTQSDGTDCTAVFSKRFIPEVKTISKADMLKKYTELQTYSNGTTHQTVKGLTIKHKQASTLLKRFFATEESTGKCKIR